MQKVTLFYDERRRTFYYVLNVFYFSTFLNVLMFSIFCHLFYNYSKSNSPEKPTETRVLVLP